MSGLAFNVRTTSPSVARASGVKAATPGSKVPACSSRGRLPRTLERACDARPPRRESRPGCRHRASARRRDTRRRRRARIGLASRTSRASPLAWCRTIRRAQARSLAHTRHTPTRGSKRAHRFARWLIRSERGFVPRYSFCLTSSTSKLSRMSFSLSSVKPSTLMPHSMPSGTSFTSSLRWRSEPTLPV